MGRLGRLFGRRGGARATCQNCGAPVDFHGKDSGTVTLSFGATAEVTTLCASCQHEAEKERQWRETGIWVGDDLPPSLRKTRPASPEELERLFGPRDEPEEPPA